MKVSKSLFKKKEAGKTLSFHASADLAKKIEEQVAISGAKSLSDFLAIILTLALSEETKKLS